MFLVLIWFNWKSNELNYWWINQHYILRDLSNKLKSLSNPMMKLSIITNNSFELFVSIASIQSLKNQQKEIRLKIRNNSMNEQSKGIPIPNSTANSSINLKLDSNSLPNYKKIPSNFLKTFKTGGCRSGNTSFKLLGFCANRTKTKTKTNKQIEKRNKIEERRKKKEERRSRLIYREMPGAVNVEKWCGNRTDGRTQRSPTGRVQWNKSASWKAPTKGFGLVFHPPTWITSPHPRDFNRSAQLIILTRSHTQQIVCDHDVIQCHQWTVLLMYFITISEFIVDYYIYLRYQYLDSIEYWWCDPILSTHSG